MPFLSIGNTISSHVPGGTVVSKITSVLGLIISKISKIDFLKFLKFDFGDANQNLYQGVYQ